MGTRILRLHYNGQVRVIPDIVVWRYHFDNLMEDIKRLFVGNGDTISKVKIECSVREICIKVVDNTSLTRCLLLGDSEIEFVIDFKVSVTKKRKLAEKWLAKLEAEFHSDEVECVGSDNVRSNGGKGSESNDVRSEDFTSDIVDMNNEVSDDGCVFSIDNELGNPSNEESETSGESVSEIEVSDDGLSNVDSDEERLNIEIEDSEMANEIDQINRMNAGIWFSKEADGSIKLKQEHLFMDIYHFRETLRDFVIQEGFEIIRKKNEKSRVTVVCKENGCPWRLHASPTGDDITFKIKTYREEHNCLRKSKFREATYTWIAKKLEYKITADPNKPISGITRDLVDMFGITGLKPMKIHRARKKARELIFGNDKDQYAQLRAYGEMVLEYNPGSVFIVTPYQRTSFDRPPIFKRMFLMFEGVKKAFLDGCRPYIGVDGCFLKGLYGGILLQAVAVDGNNGVIPLALCVVEVESKDSWLYFFEQLRDAIGVDMDGVPWTIMSDRQKGLVEAVQTIFPNVVQRFCLFHIEANFKLKFRGAELVSKLRAAGKSSNLRSFNENMQWIKDVNPSAHEWLANIPFHLWSRHAFNPVSMVDHVCNSISESLNSWLSECRDLPILSLLETYRLKVMKRFHSRFQRARVWKMKLVPNVIKRLNEEWSTARTIEVFGAGQGEFQCKVGSVLFIVNLNQWMCSCGKWRVSGIPCMHAIACIRTNNEEIENYCHDAFTVSTYLKVYRNIVHPQPDLGVLRMPQDQMQPPPLRRRPGRPSKARRLHPTEKMATQRSTLVRCSRCRQIGHNIRSCKRAPVCQNQTFSSQPPRSSSTQLPILSSSQPAVGSSIPSSQTKERAKVMRPKLVIKSLSKQQQE